MLSAINHPLGRFHDHVLKGQAQAPPTGQYHDPGSKWMPVIGRADQTNDTFMEGLAYDVYLTGMGIPAWAQRPQFSRMYLSKTAAAGIVETKGHVSRPNPMWHFMWSLLGNAQKGPGPTMSIVGDPEIDEVAERKLLHGDADDQYTRDYLHAVSHRASNQLTADAYGQMMNTLRDRMVPEKEPENMGLLLGGIL